MSEINNNGQNPQVMANGQQQVNPAPQQPIPEQGPVMMQPQMVMVQQPAKETLLDKAKRHKAAIAAAIVGIGTAITSAVMAYRKGKEAGAMQQMTVMPDPYEDNSLNPNV